MNSTIKPFVLSLLAAGFYIISLFFSQPEPVSAGLPAGLGGSIFTVVNGQRVYLSYSHIYREDFGAHESPGICPTNAPCWGENIGVQSTMGPTEFAMSNANGDYYCFTTDEGARQCAAGPFQGIPTNPVPNQCTGRNNWCGFMCAFPKHRVKAFFPDVITAASTWYGRPYKEFMDSLGLPFDENDPSGKGGGSFIARCPRNTSCSNGATNWVDPTTGTTYSGSEYFEMSVNNSTSHTGAEFEWIPPNSQPPTCSITASPDTVFGQDSSQLTVTVNDPDSTSATVLWSKPQGSCGTLDTNPDFMTSANPPLNGTATSSVSFNGNETCTNVAITATVSDGVSNEVGTCSVTVSPRKPPKCQAFNLYQGGQNVGKNYTVPSATTAFNAQLLGYDGDINLNPTALPDRLEICWGVANQSAAYYQRDTQVFGCEGTDNPTQQGTNAFFQNANKNFNQYVASLPSTYTQGLSGTAASNGLIFFMKARDSFYSSTLLSCTTHPGYNSGQGTLFKSPEFPQGIPSLYCGNNCLARVNLTPPATNPPVITAVTPQNDSEWIGPVSCSVRNPYNFTMTATDADGALDMVNAKFEMNRATSGTPQVTVEFNKSSGSTYTLRVGNQSAALSPPRARDFNGRSVWMFILRNDINVTLQGGYPLTIIGANGNETNPSNFSYIAYDVGNPVNNTLQAGLRIKFNDSAGNNWNSGNGYTFNNRWIVTDLANQNDNELRGRTLIDFVKPAGSYTSVTANGNVYTLNYAANDATGASGLSVLAGEAEHVGLLPTDYYNVRNLDENLGYDYNLNNDSAFGSRTLWGQTLNGDVLTTGSRRIDFLAPRSGTINYKVRITDRACNFADVATNQQVSTGWLMSRAGLVYSASGVNSPVPNFSNTLELPLFNPANATFPFDFNKANVNLGSELIGVGVSNPLKDIRNYIGVNGYYSAKNYADANNKSWYADLKKSADNNSVIKPDRFDKKSFNTVGTLSGNISQLCTDEGRVCVATFAGSVTANGLTCDRKAILFINGDLAITNSQTGTKHIANSGGINGCVFVVQGNTVVNGGESGSGDPYYDTVEAFVISDGNINIPTDGTDGLKVWGGLLSFSTSGKAVNSSRVLSGGSANNYPALALHHDPRYIEIASGLFEELAIYKRETGYKP